MSDPRAAGRGTRVRRRPRSHRLTCERPHPSTVRLRTRRRTSARRIAHAARRLPSISWRATRGQGGQDLAGSSSSSCRSRSACRVRGRELLRPVRRGQERAERPGLGRPDPAVRRAGDLHLVPRARGRRPGREHPRQRLLRGLSRPGGRPFGQRRSGQGGRSQQADERDLRHLPRRRRPGVRRRSRRSTRPGTTAAGRACAATIRTRSWPSGRRP